MIFSGQPPAGVAVPAAVRRAAAGAAIHPVWQNEVGGLTFRLGSGPDRRFVKWQPAGAPTHRRLPDSTVDLAAEAERLRWAAPNLAVPPVLETGSDEAGTWLITAGIAGENAVTDRWKQDPATAARAIGEGLRALHDALPVAGCPFSWSPEVRLAGYLDDGPDAERAERAKRLLAEAPPVDRLVVCHGDSCAPNTLIGDDGRWSGHVDLGRLGVADRWADLAIATWSTVWNYGPGWEKPVLDAYGIDEDPVRTDYYRRLWDFE
jgi:aminoglycoside phosphotransferase